MTFCGNKPEFFGKTALARATGVRNALLVKAENDHFDCAARAVNLHKAT